MKSTGPILAAGTISIGNRVILNGQPMDWRVPVAVGLAAGFLGIAEKAVGEPAVALAWVALVTVLFVDIGDGVPPPVVSVVNWFNQK